MSFPPDSTFLAWPPFLASLPVSLRDMLTGLEESQRWPAAKFFQGQRGQLTLLLEWAANNVPYYRQAEWPAKILGELKRSPDDFWDTWRTAPILAKADLRAQGARMYAPEVPRVHQPLGMTKTSGSTGIAVEVRTTAVTRFIWNALTLRENAWHRRDVGKRLGSTRYLIKKLRIAEGRVQPSWGMPFSNRTGSAGVIHVGYSMDLLADWLRRFDPHYLVTYPSVAASLLDEIGDAAAKPPSLEEITFISEPLSPDLEARVKAEWRIRVSEIYSSNEVGNIAFRCAQGRLHTQSEAILVEILDEAGNPCDIGESGRVVVTPLHNLGTPLIRYDLGDYATLGEPCPCGRELPVIGQVLGRVRNLVCTPDGRRYWPVALGKLRSIQSIRQAQYVQNAPDSIQLRVVLNQPLTEEERGRAVGSVREVLGYPFRVEILPVNEIERGPTGKFEEFLSLLPAQ